MLVSTSSITDCSTTKTVDGQATWSQRPFSSRRFHALARVRPPGRGQIKWSFCSLLRLRNGFLVQTIQVITASRAVPLERL
jgi:hypothetical protein